MKAMCVGKLGDFTRTKACLQWLAKGEEIKAYLRRRLRKSQWTGLIQKNSVTIRPPCMDHHLGAWFVRNGAHGLWATCCTGIPPVTAAPASAWKKFKNCQLLSTFFVQP